MDGPIELGLPYPPSRTLLVVLPYGIWAACLLRKMVDNPSDTSDQQFDRVIKRCHCVRSKCLRLYCDCFAANILCDGCKCQDCHNTSEHPIARRQAMEYKLARKKTAFQPKFKPAAANQVTICICPRSLVVAKADGW